jgi:quercetin dioxygenase-like cupin family protein
VARQTTASAAAIGGSLYIVDRESDGQSLTIKESAFALGDVPEIEGRPNAGFSYGAIFEAPSRHVGIALGHFDPNGSATPHRTRNLYVVHVVRGVGNLCLFDDGGAMKKIKFKPGDVIVLPAGALHQWVNGDEPFDFVGVEYSPAEQ